MRTTSESAGGCVGKRHGRLDYHFYRSGAESPDEWSVGPPSQTPQTLKLLALAALRLSRPSRRIPGPRAVQLYIQTMSAPAHRTYAIPEGFTLHKENTSAILLPASNDAFLNPVQEFNRDLSVACIRTWGDLINEQRRAKWEKDAERKAARRKGKKARGVFAVSAGAWWFLGSRGCSR